MFFFYFFFSFCWFALDSILSSTTSFFLSRSNRSSGMVWVWVTLAEHQQKAECFPPLWWWRVRTPMVSSPPSAPAVHHHAVGPQHLQNVGAQPVATSSLSGNEKKWASWAGLMPRRSLLSCNLWTAWASGVKKWEREKWRAPRGKDWISYQHIKGSPRLEFGNLKNFIMVMTFELLNMNWFFFFFLNLGNFYELNVCPSTSSPRWFSHQIISDSFNSMDCNLSGSSVCGIFQARILESVAISFSRGSSQPRDRTWVSCMAGSLLHCRQILYQMNYQGSPTPDLYT